MFNSRQFYNVNRASVLTPQIRAIWDNMCIGVAVVDADGICEYMNPIQRRADGFTRIPVEGQHITSLYVPHELEVIPTIECLQTGKPLLKKAYWYATSTNFLASTVTDFFPLFDHGRKDGVIAFTIWTGNTAHVSESRRPLKPCNADAPYNYYTFSSIVGRDEALQECIHEARSAATSSSPVMIWGESGTGKELFAQAIHSASSRAGHPFIPVNCAAIPENLLEGILFGTVKGAYTDAPDKPGLFEKANCGTLLFDELNSMPLGLQAKLLRVIQEKRVRRLGSHTEIPINVRIISILNEHPLRAVDQGLLRRDLFYRLAVVGIAVPPLRKRQNDIPLLVRHIINRSELAMKTAGVTLDDEVMGIFRRYPWPATSGNWPTSSRAAWPCWTAATSSPSTTCRATSARPATSSPRTTTCARPCRSCGMRRPSSRPLRARRRTTSTTAASGAATASPSRPACTSTSPAASATCCA